MPACRTVRPQVRRLGPASFLALSLVACGVPAVVGPLDTDSGTDTNTGGGSGHEQGTSDGGAFCECGAGFVCVPSTGECVAEADAGIDEPDAGPPHCTDGDVRSCGASKLGECRLGSSTCTDGAWSACTGHVDPAPEICNAKDDDCDGLIDEDQPDVACGTGQCRRMHASCINGTPTPCTPGAPSAELCNGLDDDCDGTPDNGLPTLACGVGACARTVPACSMTMAQTCTPGLPSAETCNGADDDCDGQTDEGLGSTTCGQGSCTRTVQNCVSGMAQTCMPGAPGTEACNGADDDCDGMTDEGFGMLTCGTGACFRSVPACSGGMPGTCTPGGPVPELCNGVDDDCDGTVDDGVCTPVVTCPMNRTVNPNTSVALATTAMSPAGRPLTCQWTVVSRPAGSSGAFSAPASCTSTNYDADVVGTHTLQFTTTDSAGVSSSCTVTITVNAPPAGLWVELTWNRPNDMDLHLQHPSGGNNHNRNGWGSNASPYDCYWLNTNPSWDAAGTADDPSLDRDDITGTGPENIRITSASTTHDYTVGVHLFTLSSTPSNVTATVRIYCSGVLRTTQTRQFNREDDMWVVGAVRFATNGSCTFTPDNFVFDLTP